ncbi:hypothetical protein ES708_13602 [subsurface metagenome]
MFLFTSDILSLNPHLKPFKERNPPTFTYSDRTKVYGKLIDEVQSDSQLIDEKATGIVYRNLIQKIRLEDGNEVFRFCYSMINLDDEEPKWIYRQSALTLNNRELKELLNQMKEKGWINITFI